MSCVVRRCRSRSGNKENIGENISFHKFPKTEDIRQRWFVAADRSEKLYKRNWKMCSRHFNPNCFQSGNLLRQHLKENAVPTLNSPSKTEAVLGCSRLDVVSLQQRSMSDSLLPMPQETTSTGLLTMPLTASQIAMNAVYEGRIDKLQKQVQKLELIAKNRLLKLNALKQQTRRLRKKNSNINLRLIELLEKEKIDKEYLIMLECVKTNKIIEKYLCKAQGQGDTKEYSLELKKFAVTLHYLSPKAYSFVRNELKNILPHPNTISKWYRSLNCNPGFTTEALDAIKERVAQNNGKPLYGALSMDEMAIRKNVEWDGRHYFGYANVGCDIDADDAPIAKEALTFMVTSMNDTWKIPVGYFLLVASHRNKKLDL